MEDLDAIMEDLESRHEDLVELVQAREDPVEMESPELWWEELEESPCRKKRTNHRRSKESEYYLDAVF